MAAPPSSATASDQNLTSPGPPSLPLKDRVAIVTGSSRGIGRAVAIHLAQLGARLVVNYSSRSSDADAVVAEINAISGAEGQRAIALRADVSEPDGVRSLFDAAERVFNAPVYILVNSAGVLDPKYPTIANTSLEDFDRIFSINARGSFLCCKEAAKRLKRGGGGRIILFSSSLTRVSRPGYGVYTASKAATEAMTKIIAKELRGTRITANCVLPGPTATEMFFEGKSEETIQAIVQESPLERLGETKDVAPLVGVLGE